MIADLVLPAVLSPVQPDHGDHSFAGICAVQHRRILAAVPRMIADLVLPAVLSPVQPDFVNHVGVGARLDALERIRCQPSRHLLKHAHDSLSFRRLRYTPHRWPVLSAVTAPLRPAGGRHLAPACGGRVAGQRCDKWA